MIFLNNFHNIINIIIFIFIFLLFPETVVLSNEHYIEFRVNKKGYNQLLSDEFIGLKPSNIYINNSIQILQDKKVYVESTNDIIKFEWSQTLNNFSYMFSNLTTISSIYMHYMFGDYDNMSYMFINCINLENFTFDTYYDCSHRISNMKGMFYNCTSLKSFSFNNLFLYYCYINSNSYYYYGNMSYMFYNCKNLKEISYNPSQYYYVNDLRNMFYNCLSILSLNLRRFSTSSSLTNISYMFYNCENLKQVTLINYIKTNDMRYMFYNCKSIKEIYFGNYYSYYINNYYYYVNMSYLFYNCHKLSNLSFYFGNIIVNDAREMFYNCYSLKNIEFRPYQTAYSPNMSKMFYNCSNIQKIIIGTLNNHYYFYTTDTYSIFYNCSSLYTLYLHNFCTSQTLDMRYMFYNCNKLEYLYWTNCDYNNQLIKSLKGIFQNCESLKTINMTALKVTQVESTWNMFKGCIRLISLNLNNFDTSKVTDMESMFEGCSSLTFLDLRSFRTTKVKYMNKMFKDCISLKSIYLNSITSESLGTMHQMFYNCNNLEYLNIYSLTERAQTFVDIFEGASNHFELCIKENENIPNIFKLIFQVEGRTRDCSSKCYGYTRESIPEKKLCCPYFKYNDSCFDQCPPKTFHNNTRICKYLHCEYAYNYYQNECLNNTPNGFYMNDTISKTIDMCNNNCLTCEGKSTYCTSCKNDLPFLYFGICNKTCEFGYYNDSGIIRCECSSIECEKCSEESITEGYCLSCNEKNGYYPKIDEPINNQSFIKCYKNPEEYYLDGKIYKRCFPSCKKCYQEGNDQNHLCLSCNANYTFKIKFNKYSTYTNCYKLCPKYFKYDPNNIPYYSCHETCNIPEMIVDEINQCVEACNKSLGYNWEFRKKCYKSCNKCPDEAKPDNDKPFKCKVVCPYEKPFELILTQICVSNCTIIQRKNKECITNYNGNVSNSEMQDRVQTDILNNMIKGFDNFNLSDNESIILEENDTFYEIITSNNKNKNNKTSSLDLGECEETLKSYYGIGSHESLYIFKLDTKIEGKTGPTVEYKVFYKFPGTNSLSPLDLTVCEGSDVKISYPIDLENPEYYDKDSPLYSDICYSYSSKSGVDVTLDDRRQEYSDNNKSLCEENCKYIGYDEKNKQVECNCEIKINFPLISTIKIDKNKLYKFMNIKKIINFDVLKCYYLLISKDGLEINIGFYVYIPILIMYFVSIFLFYKKEYKILKEQIKDLVYAKRNLKYISEKKKKKEIIEKNNKIEPLFKSFYKMKNNLIRKIDKPNIKNNKLRKMPLNLIPHSIIKEAIIEETINLEKDSINKNKDKSIQVDNQNIKNTFNDNNDKNYPPKKNIKNDKNIKNEDEKVYENNNVPSSKVNLESNKNSLGPYNTRDDDEDDGILSKEEIKKIKEIMKHNDSELNDLEYIHAIKYDKRNYFGYYFSLLKTKHMLFQILAKYDYNSRIIKIFLCFFNFGLNYTINALFFSEGTMHQIYEDDGEFNFIYQLPQIIYSTIITFIIETILNFLALSENNVLSIKHEKVTSIVGRKAKNVLRIIHFKFINFFFFSFIFILLFWYYISCFCAVYKNTQFHLIKDTLISFGISMITPLGINLLPGLFRIPGIKRKSSALFSLSKILQML